MDQSEWNNQIAVGYPTMKSGRILQSDLYDAISNK